MKVYLIRHGETTGDIEDRVGGTYDDPLTEKGREQLLATAKRLMGKDIQVIFSSPLIRAQESARIISDAMGYPVEIKNGFQERHYGVITGLTKAEAKEKYPEAMERHHDLTYTHPDGESYTDFYARVLKEFQEIAHQDYETIAILGHGGSLKCILKHLDQPLPDKIGDGEILKLTIETKNDI